MQNKMHSNLGRVYWFELDEPEQLNLSFICKRLVILHLSVNPLLPYMINTYAVLGLKQ